MAIQDVVQQILGVLLTYLELAVVIVLLYMIIKLFTGEGSIGESAWNAFKDRDKDGKSSKSNSPERSNSNQSGTGGNGGGDGTGNGSGTPEGDETEVRDLPPGTADWNNPAQVRFVVRNLSGEAVPGVKIELFARTPEGKTTKLMDKSTDDKGDCPSASDVEASEGYQTVPSGTLSYRFHMEPANWMVSRVIKRPAKLANLFRWDTLNPFNWYKLGRSQADTFLLFKPFRQFLSDDPWKGNGGIIIQPGEKTYEYITINFYSHEIPDNFEPHIIEASLKELKTEPNRLTLRGVIK